MDVNESDVVMENEEVGFFFIKDTIVTIQNCNGCDGNTNDGDTHDDTTHYTTTEPTKNNDSNSTYNNYYLSDKWIDVTIREEESDGGEGDNDDDGTKTEEKKEEVKEQQHSHCIRSTCGPKKAASPEDSKICPRCNVVLHKCSSSSSSSIMATKEGHNDHNMEYRISKQSVFNGLLKDSTRCDWCVHVDNCMNEGTTKQKKEKIKTKTKRLKKKIKKQRTDAALLLGTILQCKSAGFLKIQKFQILFCGDTDIDADINARKDEKETNLKYNEKNERRENGTKFNTQSDGTTVRQKWKEVKCALVITVSLPHLENVSQAIVHQSSSAQKGKNVDVQYDEYLTTQSRGFAPYGQLTFSLIRSDWSWLDSTMQHLTYINKQIIRSQKSNAQQQLEKKSNQRSGSGSGSGSGRSTTSFFPPTLSLEELYCRIRGASTHQIPSYIKFDASLNNNTNVQEKSKEHLSTLPTDVMISNIAPFLRAKSLHHLRMTCKYINYILRGVVPGMKLKLYPHQVRSLQWMRQREMRCVNDDDAMQTGCDNIAYSDNTLCGDFFRSVSAGSIVSVTPRRRKDRNNSSFWHINTWTGGCSIHYRNERLRTVAKCRSVARGGLLCDDPGMGKTITFLSCILQTFGQSTEKTNTRIQKKQITDDLIVDSYWREHLVRSTRHDELYSIYMQLCKCDLGNYFRYPIRDFLSPENYKHYCSIIKDPICLEDIISKVREDEYSDSISDFAKDVRKIYTNATKYNDINEDIHQQAVKILKLFESIFEDFRLQQLTAAIGAQKRSKQSLSSLVSESRKTQLLDTLISSRGTLLVVPNTLTDHWEEQIRLHVDFSACSNKSPLIFRRKGKGMMHKGSQILEVGSKHQVNHYCNVVKSHYPFLFIDACNEKLPSESFLSQFYVVLTTTKRLTLEWKHGSFEEELRKSRGNTSNYRSLNYDMFNEHNRCSPCPLLKVHWLRLVVDEGHTMGKKGSPTNAIEFASWITAKYRWAMTGTPTPQKKKCGADNLFGLMKFLKHDYFMTPHFGEERSKAFSKALKDGQIAAFARLQYLLNLFMVRHTKQDVELHKPVFAMTRTDLSQQETRAYDTLVTAVQMNLITTSMKGKTSGAQDSILNSRQAKHAHTALRNIRLACSGGTSIVPTLTTKHWTETLDLMRIKHKVDEKKMSKVENFLTRMTTEQLSVCGCCGVELQTLFLLPCACQICTECMNPSTKHCVSCKTEFDIDDFQLLQPGLDYVWKWNLVEAQKQREEKQNMEASIRESLITAQGRRTEVLAEDNQNQVEDNPQQAQLQQHQRRRRSSSEAHICKYPNLYVDGKCKICGEIHPCNFMRQRKCTVCHCVAEDCPKEESKAYYIIEKLLNLWSVYQNRGIDPMTGEEKRPLKVLIFTQFQQVSNLVGDRLIRRFGTACVAEYWGSTRNFELERFRSMTDCFCMLLNRNGSHGLNLSFVTHIFFLDEILDKSLESQVVSRAYRMGATENVFVEQLVSRHSIEELIVLMNKREEKKHDMLYANSADFDEFESEYYDSGNFCPDEDKNKTDSFAKVHYLLSNMKLIRPNHIALRKRTSNNNSSNPQRRKRVRFAD